jgi:hypothetical protein
MSETKAWGRRGPGWLRLDQFLFGVAVGIPLSFGLMLGVTLALGLLSDLARGPVPRAAVQPHLTFNGSDISRRGGVQVVVRHGGGLLRQTCNGVCDDLRIDGSSALPGAQVLDRNGKCIECDRPLGFLLREDAATISGRETLNVERRRDDG